MNKFDYYYQLLRNRMPKKRTCEICHKRYSELYQYEDFASIEEHGVCVDCGKIKFKD